MIGVTPFIGINSMMLEMATSEHYSIRANVSFDAVGYAPIRARRDSPEEGGPIAEGAKIDALEVYYDDALIGAIPVTELNQKYLQVLIDYATTEMMRHQTECYEDREVEI